MLRELTVRDLGLIDRARVTFGPGLTVITGETGAGKSLLIDALGLVMGARADSGLVRHGAAGARGRCWGAQGGARGVRASRRCSTSPRRRSRSSACASSQPKAGALLAS